jgi:hypothetical protein
MRRYRDGYGVGPWHVYELNPDTVQGHPSITGGVYNGVTFSHHDTEQELSLVSDLRLSSGAGPGARRRLPARRGELS